MNGDYIDINDALPRLGNNEGLYKKLLKSFLSEKSVPMFEESIRANDIKNSQYAAHTIKGIAANLSLKALHREAAAADAQLKEGKIEEASVNSFKAVLNETIDEVKKYLGE